MTASNGDKAGVEQLALARQIVKQFYPEMKPDYSGRRVQIVLAALRNQPARTDGASNDHAGLIERLRTTRLLSQRNQLAIQAEAADALQALSGSSAREVEVKITEGQAESLHKALLASLDMEPPRPIPGEDQ